MRNFPVPQYTQIDRVTSRPFFMVMASCQASSRLETDPRPTPRLVLQLQKCGEEFQAASVMAAPGRCLVPPSPPGPPQH